jgi:uncharacterized small protein (DUF1192 family)
MAQVSNEIINLLSVDYLNAKITDIIKNIEREKLTGDVSYELTGEDYAKK